MTPDSFSDGGLFLDPEPAVRQAASLIAEGADLVDLGAESTRPGAHPVSFEEEISRLMPALRLLRERTSRPISIDTTKAEVARRCLEAGADIINDVSGLKDDPEMAGVVREFGAGVVLMHRRGNPATMQSLSRYQDVVEEVARELAESIEIALSAGIEREAVAIDPGIGFAKETRHNLEILAGLGRFQQMGFPVFLGPSRKSFIGEITGRAARDRTFGTAGVAAYAAMKGVSFLRVHDVSAIRDVIRMVQEIEGASHVRTF